MVRENPPKDARQTEEERLKQELKEMGFKN